MKQVTTHKGKLLLLRGLSGANIRFTKIKFGNGETQAEDAADLSNPIMELAITSITREESFITLETSYKNADVPTDFSALEIGVFAQDPDDESKEILYCFWYEDNPVKADYISSVEDRILGTKFEFHIFVSTVKNVTAILAESTDHVSKHDFDDHVKNYKNPHNVTKEQVGLGNVPNVTPENQVPSFSNTISEIKTEEDGSTTFDNVANGDTMGTILNKIRTAISVLLSHINGKNPHKITAKGINAAESSHYHTATDIRSGTLTIPRGGTGASTAPEARTALGIQAGTTDAYASIGDGFPANEEILLTTQFPVAFSNPPIVTVTLVDMNGCSNTDHIISVERVTAKEFTVRVYSDSVIPGVQFNWIAVG